MDYSSLLRIDKNHIWHPYAPAIDKKNNFLVKNAKGVYLYLHNKKKLIDGISSWWSVIHGYNHSILNAVIRNQLNKMAHVMFGGLTHRPAVELTKKLIRIVPKGLSHVFYSDSGSVAVEIAMKIAIQYWFAKGKNLKKKFIAIKNGYHGDTWHAMSICDTDTGMHQIFKSQLPQQLFSPCLSTEYEEDKMDKLLALLEKEYKSIAAFILEPVVQGAGGMKFYHPGYLKTIRKFCDDYNILLIADEIATGFGRTGKLFACEHAAIVPDIMCLGKTLTGGYLSFGATLCNQEIAETISNHKPNILLHGPTFTANPLACAVSKASIDLLLKSNWQKNINRIENHFKDSLSELKSHRNVKNIRMLGGIAVIEMKTEIDIATFQESLAKHNVWLRPFKNIIYTIPPYIISNKELNLLTDGICNSIYEVYGER